MSTPPFEDNLEEKRCNVQKMKPKQKGDTSRMLSHAGSRVGTPTPWVWGDESDFDGGSGNHPFGVTRITVSR